MSLVLAPIVSMALASCAIEPTAKRMQEISPPGRVLPELTLRSVGEGLPRTGQWRSQVAVADVDGDGRSDLLLPPARKGNGRPHIFMSLTDGKWAPWDALRLPRSRYDYGGIAALDFDGDGRLDIALGMHLRGVAALRQSSLGEFEDADSGLNPSAPGGRPPANPSSQSVLRLPSANTGDRLAVVYEPQNVSGAPGATIWRYADRAWRGTVVPDAPRGTHAALVDERIYYLGGGAIMMIDPREAAPRAMIAAKLPPGVFGHSLAIHSRTHAYVANSEFFNGAWQRKIDRIPIYHGNSSHMVSGAGSSIGIQRSVGPTYGAVAVVAARHWGGTGELLAVGDDQGTIDLFAVEGNSPARRVATLAASTWRTRCPVSNLFWVTLAIDSPPQLLATFSGERSVYDLDAACLAGGGVDLFAVEPSVRGRTN
jgi:hypothetical protein